jgi:hypothetical protein
VALGPVIDARQRDKDPRIYLFGDLVSTLGDNALWLAMGIWMKEMTGSSGWAGLVFFCFALGNLLSPPRRRRRRQVPAATAAHLREPCRRPGRAADPAGPRPRHDMARLPGHVRVRVLGSAMGPAQTALLPAIVGEDLLAEANGAQQTLNEGLRLVTPLIGAGLFVLVGGGLMAVIDAGTFLIAAASLAALRVTEPAFEKAETGTAEPGGGQAESGQAEKGKPKAEDKMSAGFRFLAGEPVLRSITITLA